jgi:hypothetical protein
MQPQYNYYQPPSMRQGFPPYYSPQPVMSYDTQLVHRDRLFHMPNGNHNYYAANLLPSPDLVNEQRNQVSSSEGEDSDDSASSTSALEREKIQQRMADLGREAIVLERLEFSITLF